MESSPGTERQLTLRIAPQIPGNHIWSCELGHFTPDLLGCIHPGCTVLEAWVIIYFVLLPAMALSQSTAVWGPYPFLGRLPPSCSSMESKNLTNKGFSHAPQYFRQSTPPFCDLQTLAPCPPPWFSFASALSFLTLSQSSLCLYLTPFAIWYQPRALSTVLVTCQTSLFFFQYYA